jgi:single-stranded DNA-specific DHH superfamily exonuclease
LSFLHLVALGTVADVVPLKGLNRAFVCKGLIALRRREHVGQTALMDVARLSGPPEPYHLGFLLGPRINAGGRIGRADLGVRLLMENDPVRRRGSPPSSIASTANGRRSNNKRWQKPKRKPWRRSVSRREAPWW